MRPIVNVVAPDILGTTQMPLESIRTFEGPVATLAPYALHGGLFAFAEPHQTLLKWYFHAFVSLMVGQGIFRNLINGVVAFLKATLPLPCHIDMLSRQNVGLIQLAKTLERVLITVLSVLVLRPVKFTLNPVKFTLNILLRKKI